LSEETQLIPVDSIKPASLNLSRRDSEVVNMLVADIRSCGICRIDPILVRKLPPEEAKPPAIYEVVDGHKRLEAVKRIGLPTIRARIIDADREEALELNYRKNKERSEIDEVLEAFYFLHLSEDLKMPAYRIAEKFGMKEAVVTSIINRAKLTREARRIIWRDIAAGGKAFTRRHLEILSSMPAEVQVKLAEIIYEKKLSPAEAEKVKELLMAPEESEKKNAKAIEGKPKAPETKKTEAFKVGAQEGAPKFNAQPGKREAASKNIEVFTCPKCSLKVEVDWENRLLRWRE